MSIRLAIVGSRYFNDYQLLEKYVMDLETELQIDGKNVDTIVSGGCRGADKLAEQYAKKHNKKLDVYKPDWSRGKKAGPERNTVIVKNSDYVIAFPSSDSKGTYDTIRKAKLKGIPVKVKKI